MSSDGRRPGSNTRGRGDGRPGSRGTRTTAANGKPGPGRKSAASNDYMKNKSNSATMNEKSLPTDNNRNVAASKAGAVDGRIKVLGQDAEMTESDLWNLNGISSGKTTPLSSRSSTGGSSYRTPTPSKQISLQAVKRKEENTEPLETIDWNDFLNPVEEERPVSNVSDSRIPSPPVSDSEDSDRDSGLNVMEDRLMLVERRAQEMASALDSHPLNELEENLSKQLERMELEREENERLEKEKEGELISNRERQSNETFRDFDSGNTNHLVKETAIVGASVQPGRSRDPGTVEAQGTSADDIFTVGVGARPKVNTETASKSDSLDTREAVVAAHTNDAQSNEKKKKKEASSSETKETEESTSDEESEEEEDLIGYKGKAPTQLLMEFLDCMMTEDYTTAEKLCKMILIYEPNNEEALSFYPLIQEKIKQEEEEEEESDSDDDDDDDDDEEDDDDDDDDEDDDDEDDESSSDESEDDKEGIPDSGIVSANSDRD